MARKKERDERLGDESTTRKDRAMDDRDVTQTRELTDGERLDEFRKTFFQSALPDIPQLKGFHVCWLTTENPRDSITARERLGYQVIKAADVPGWDYSALKSALIPGAISVNEMVAFKLPIHLYEAYMKEAHHDQPLMEEQKLNEATRMAEEGASQIARKPISFELEDGQAGFGATPGAPASFEDHSR